MGTYKTHCQGARKKEERIEEGEKRETKKHRSRMKKRGFYTRKGFHWIKQMAKGGLWEP